MLFGSLKTQYLKKYKEISIRELLLFIYFIIIILFLGIRPNYLLYLIENYSLTYFYNLQF